MFMPNVSSVNDNRSKLHPFEINKYYQSDGFESINSSSINSSSLKAADWTGLEASFQMEGTVSALARHITSK